MTVRPAFERAAGEFVAVVESLRADQWSAPGLGDWTVRELVGHCGRALLTVVRFVDEPQPAVEIDDVAAYVTTALAIPDLHVGVAERGREAGVLLGDDPVATVRQWCDEALGAVRGCRGDEIGRTAVGAMTLEAYLQTRIVELVTHTLDVCAAVGIDPPDFGEAGQVALAAIVSIVTDPATTATLVRGLLGREPLPEGFNLFG